MPRAHVDRSLLQGESIEIFRAAIKSKWTLDPYERRLLRFLQTVKMTPDEFVALAKKDVFAAEKKVIAYVTEEKQRCESGEISPATVGNALKAIRLLSEMNDAFLNWRKIKRLLPRSRRYAIDRIPTDVEIAEIVNAADIRGKALTLTLLSSGIREGAIDALQVGDLSPAKKNDHIVAGKLIVYRGDEEEYVTFVSIEAYEALQKYLAFRLQHGEQIAADSPLFRDKFDPIKGKYGYGKEKSSSKAIPMTGHAVRLYYNRLLRTLGIRKETKRRHEFSVHGFRKAFKTKAEIAGMKPINVEVLMGHSTGISDSYYRPTDADLLDDYLKVMASLTVSQEKQLRQEVERLKIDNSDMESMRKQMFEMENRMRTMQAKIDAYSDVTESKRAVEGWQEQQAPTTSLSLARSKMSKRKERG